MDNKCNGCKYFNNELCCKGIAYRLITVEMKENCKDKEEL
jgi:hypothetical protein